MCGTFAETRKARTGSVGRETKPEHLRTPLQVDAGRTEEDPARRLKQATPCVRSWRTDFVEIPIDDPARRVPGSHRKPRRERASVPGGVYF